MYSELSMCLRRFWNGSVRFYNAANVLENTLNGYPMDLLPDTQNSGLRMHRDAGNVFPATDFKGNR